MKNHTQQPIPKPLPLSDDKIWEELLHTEASQRYLAAQVKNAEKLLDKEFPQKNLMVINTWIVT